MPGVAGRFCLRKEGEQDCHGRCGSLRGGVGGEVLSCGPVPLARGEAVRHAGMTDMCAARRPRLLVVSPRLLVFVSAVFNRTKLLGGEWNFTHSVKDTHISKWCGVLVLPSLTMRKNEVCKSVECVRLTSVPNRAQAIWSVENGLGTFFGSQTGGRLGQKEVTQGPQSRLERHKRKKKKKKKKGR